MSKYLWPAGLLVLLLHANSLSVPTSSPLYIFITWFIFVVATSCSQVTQADRPRYRLQRWLPSEVCFPAVEREAAVCGAAFPRPLADLG